MHCDWQGKFAWMPEKLWRQLEPLLPKYPRSTKVGRPRANLRTVASGILYLLRTGCQWKALPPQFGSPSTVHRYFQEWTRLGIWQRFWKRGWGSTIRSAASLGAGSRWTARQLSRRWEGKKTGKNPTDRGKLGVKRSVLTDARGVPLGVAIDGANAHDQRLLRDTLRSIPIRRPSRRRKQHLCLDKGYFGEPSTATANRFGYVPHIRCRGEEQRRCRAGHKARRWVVEAAHSWTNRARRLLIRWEKKAANYLGFVHLQFALIALRRCGILG